MSGQPPFSDPSETSQVSDPSDTRTAKERPYIKGDEARRNVTAIFSPRFDKKLPVSDKTPEELQKMMCTEHLSKSYALYATTPTKKTWKELPILIPGQTPQILMDIHNYREACYDVTDKNIIRSYQNS